MKSLILILSLLAISFCGRPEGCTADASPHPLVNNTQRLLKSVLHGKKYGIDYDGRDFLIVNLQGSAYEMGYAYGSLLKEELKAMEPEFFAWLENFIATNVSVINQLPAFLKKYVAKSGVKMAKVLLGLNYKITKKYTPERYDEEMLGIARGSGTRLSTIRQINLLPELLKASCSILGAWGKATYSGELIQLRALDWEAHAPMSRFPLITVYHSTEPGSVPFANIAWVGFIGSLTGYSSAKIGVSERLRGGPAKSMTRYGKPWTYVLRDVMQFSKTIDDALDQLKKADRTCSVYFGIGSSVSQTYRIVEYSYKELNIYDDTNWHFDDHHPKTPGLIWKAYIDGKPCFKNLLIPKYGQIDAELIYKYVAPMSETGDSQVIVMDYAKNHIYANYPQYKTAIPGFQRPAVLIDLNPHFAAWK